MRELAVLTFVTLDGVMQAPGHPDEDRSGDFAHGGWATGHWSEVMALVLREAMVPPYDLLLGRSTYDGFAAHFTAAADDDPVATILGAARKYVVTSTPLTLPWRRSSVLDGDVVAAVEELKQSSGLRLQIHGSWQLLQALQAADIIDEYRICTFPVTLGAGKRLFDGSTRPSEFRLIRSETTRGGVTLGIYRRRRASP